MLLRYESSNKLIPYTSFRVIHALAKLYFYRDEKDAVNWTTI